MVYRPLTKIRRLATLMFFPHRAPDMRSPSYESLNSIEIFVDGTAHSGTYRVMNGSVIVYYGGEVKFASVGMNLPELVAKWLLTDLVRRGESRRRKSARD